MLHYKAKGLFCKMFEVSLGRPERSASFVSAGFSLGVSFEAF